MSVYGPDGNLCEEIAYGTAGFASLSAVSVVGVGAVLNGGACRANHCLVVTGTGTATVVLQASVDGQNWFTLGTTNADLSESFPAATLFVPNQPAQYLRADVTAIDGTVTATIASA